MQAKQLAKSFGNGGQLGDGGVIQGGSHASGNDVPIMGGRYRVEGREMITNVRSTENNSGWLHFINSAGKNKRLTLADFVEADNVRVLPHPTGRTFAGGGQLPSDAGGSGPTNTMVIQQVDLSALVANTNVMLVQLNSIIQHTASTAVSAQLTAEKPPIVPDYEIALAFEQKAKEARQAESAATV